MSIRSSTDSTWWAWWREQANRRIELPRFSSVGWLHPARLWPPSRREQLALLRLLKVASEHQLPLVPLLKAHASDSSGGHQARISKLISQLNSGVGLPDAADAVAGLLSPSQRLALRFGAQSGTLAQSLDQEIAAHVVYDQTSCRQWQETAIYFAAVTLVAVLVIGFVLFKVFDGLAHLQQEFGLSPNWSFRVLIELRDLIRRDGPVLLVTVLVVCWLAWSGILGHIWRNSRWTRWLYRPFDRRPQQLLSLLSTAAAAGRPLAGAISTLARYHYDRTLRQKLLFVRNEIEQGASAWLSLRQAGLINAAQKSALEQSETIRSVAETLRLLADADQRKRVRHIGWSAEIARLVMIAILGFVVVLFSLAVFASMVCNPLTSGVTIP